MIQTISHLHINYRAGMVGAVVRSLLSDHKVPSLILPLSRCEFLCDLLCT